MSSARRSVLPRWHTTPKIRPRYDMSGITYLSHTDPGSNYTPPTASAQSRRVCCPLLPAPPQVPSVPVAAPTGQHLPAWRRTPRCVSCWWAPCGSQRRPELLILSQALVDWVRPSAGARGRRPWSCCLRVPWSSEDRQRQIMGEGVKRRGCMRWQVQRCEVAPCQQELIDNASRSQEEHTGGSTRSVSAYL